MEYLDYQHQGLKVTGVDPDGIAAGFDLPENSRLVMVNGRPLPDLFTFRLIELEPELTLLFWEEREGLFEIELEKDEDEPLGLSLEIVTDEVFTHCHNGCVFCFIDQLPEGMRGSLYFKDDDMRLSFLHGNYITLTNLKEAELDRLIALRFSPINVSVHTTDPELRQKMMRNRFAGNVLERLKKITEAGLDVNVQIVLCPDLNDKAHLERTFDDLATLNELLRSVACVPVGLTRYRDENGLFSLRPHTKKECLAVIETVYKRQQEMLSRRAERVFYLADEFYLKAGVEIPAVEAYEDFYQIENGVGMVARFNDDLQALLETPGRREKADGDILVATGRLAEPVLSAWSERLTDHFGLPIRVAGIDNHFFGKAITVSGLLTGQDLLSQVKPHLTPETRALLLPDNMVRAGSELFLDDVEVSDLRTSFSLPVEVVSETANGLFSGIDRVLEGF